MAGSVLTYLDGYCERAGEAGLFAEPLNLVTNIFFIIAAILCGVALCRSSSEGRRIDLWLMVGFMFSIGIGSGLWHAVPSGTTVLMDVIPITLFINAYILSALRRLFGLPWIKVAIWWGIYFAAGIAAQYALPPNLLNGTIMYIPTYLALVVMTLALRPRDALGGPAFTWALMGWTLSLVFRTVDHDICPSIGFGTHFLWHTLNAWVLWRLLMVLIYDAAMISKK